MNTKYSLFDFFDKSYVINLPERKDRLNAMKQELKRMGISQLSEKVQIFSAIKPTDKGEFPSIGSRGCFLSHLGVLKEAKNQNLSYVLIMEDDLLFSNRLIKEQEKVVKELEDLDWDFAYLGHILELTPTTRGIFQYYNEPLVTAHFVAIKGKIINQLVDFLETLLSRPAEHPDGGPMYPDAAYSTFRARNPNIITLIANPCLGFQRPTTSDLAGYKWFETWPVFAELTAAGRSVKNLYLRSKI